MIKPPRLQPGDRVAAISMSSGAAARFPQRYQAGRRQFEEAFGIEIVPTPNALRDDDWLHANPEARAEDLHWALSNPDIAGLVSTIGGEDSVRTLPFLDLELIRSHPKILLGFSDTTVVHTAFLLAGVTAYSGPSLLTDLAENAGMHPYTEEALRKTLFSSEPFEIAPAAEWTEEFLDWARPELQERRRDFLPSPGWLHVQGEPVAQGRLLGGCAEVLEMIKGTPWWPQPRFWRGGLLCLETSEMVPSPAMAALWLRNYGMQGVLREVNGLLLGRPMGYDRAMREELYAQVRRVLAEFGREDLTVVAEMDFGHTSPQTVLPLGCEARVDAVAQRLQILEGTGSEG